MQPRRPGRFAVGLVMAASLAVGGCVATGGSGTNGNGGSTSPSVTPATPSPTGLPHPTAANELVIRVQTVGGFVAPSFHLTAYPTVSIYGDGSVITQGPQIEIFPGPLLPNLQVRHISASGVQQLLAAAKLEGLFERSGSFDAVGIADAGTTELTFVTDTRHTISAYALGEDTDDQGIDQGTKDVRAAMRRVVAKLTDLPTTLGAAVLDAEQPFHATSLRLFVTAGAPATDQGVPAQEARTWPLATPLAAFGAPFTNAGMTSRCGVVTGADLAALTPGLQRANALTPWLSAGSTFSLIAHPLLPGETGCPAGDPSN